MGMAAAIFAPGHAGAEALEGQIVVDEANPRWFRYHGGGPFFMAGPGDPEGFLYRGKLRADGTRDGDQLKLIRKLGKSGANSIYLMAVRSHGGDGEATHNPFVGHDPANGFNEAVLDQWESWFQEMDRQGIVIYFIFFDDSSRLWNTKHEVQREEREFLHALVDRFEHHRHLIWVVAEEYQERFTYKRVSKMAAEIRAADDHDHPIAVHKWHGLDFEEFADDPALDQYAIQFNAPEATELYRANVAAWHKANARYNINLAEANWWGRGKVARQKAWSVAMAGAYVMAYQMDIASTPMSDLEDCGRLVDFMESTDFHRMEPRSDLGAGDTRYVLAQPGTSYIAYANEGRGALGLRDLEPGRYRLRWLDTANGREAIEETSVSSSTTLWRRPAGIGKEAAVYVQRIEASEPTMVVASGAQ